VIALLVDFLLAPEMQTPGNLLQGPGGLFTPDPHSAVYRELNQGSWFCSSFDANRRKFGRAVYTIPIIFWIDGLILTMVKGTQHSKAGLVTTGKWWW
jgi:hypothetical protein